MDGSAKEFLDILDETETKTLSKKRKYLKVINKVELLDGERKISVEPNNSFFVVDFQLNYENEIMLKDGAALFTTDVNEIEKNLKILFNDEKVRNNLISKGNKFVNNYIGNQGTASKKLAKILEDYG